MKKILLTLTIALSFGLTACDKPKEEVPASETAAQEEKPAAEAPAAEAEAEPAAPKVEVAAAGAKLEPPVKPEQLPDGAWYCDMGTVHWASIEKPEDGKCPECGMQLKQYASADHAAQKAKAIEAKPDDHGHEHGEGEDDHGHEH